MENLEDMATIMTYESGKPLVESRGEVVYGTSFLEYYAAEALRPTSTGGGVLIPTPFVHPPPPPPSTIEEGSGGVCGRPHPSLSPPPPPRGRILSINEAVGVCGLITPWNFPLAMITRKAGPALAAGCTIVLKPSDLTPLTAVALSVLATRAGIPKGVFELVTTDAPTTQEVGVELCGNPLVKKISFTGSTQVGKLLMSLSATTVKRLSLELGGNAPFIVFDDADIDLAVGGAMSSKFRNAGQTCVCADRFIVHKDVEAEFVTKLADKVTKLTVQHGMKEDGGIPTMGPVISERQVHVLKEKVHDAIVAGATCITGGSPLVDIGTNYFEPTIVTNVKPSMSIWHTETFGPVVAITTFDTDEQALDLANDTRTGLASYFYTKDMSRIFRVSAALENGMVGVNEGIISSACAPFGGVKESGLGREGSTMGIHEYLETKYVFLNV